MAEGQFFQIAVNKYTISEERKAITIDKVYDGHFLDITLASYFEFCDEHLSSFFSGTDVEVQRNILKNRFGLTEEQILSWQEKATSYNMTPESFSLFLHMAIYAGDIGYRSASIKKYLAETAEEKTARDQGTKKTSKDKSKSKKSKKDKKKKRHIPDSDDDSSDVSGFIQSNLEYLEGLDDDVNIFDDDRENIINRPIDKDAMAVDRDSTIDRPIAETSGSTPLIVDQSLLHIVPEKPISQIVITPDPQQEKQSEEKTTSTKSLNKNKSKINNIQKVITGHNPDDDGTSNVREILVYDIPASWTVEEILKQLLLWGKTISIQTKRQRKYQTLRLQIELSTFRMAQFEGENPVWTTDLGGIPVRWFPARWTLKERKQREKFQATIRKVPASMTLATLWADQRPHSFLTAIKGLKSFKVIKTAKGDRKLIGYFEKWTDMRAALDNQSVWEDNNLSWNRHDPPTQRTRSQGTPNTDKNQRTSSNKKRDARSDSQKSNKKPQDKKSDKLQKQKKKDKSRDNSRSKVLAEILDLLRKIV